MLAVEAEPEDPVDPDWVHGRFCLWASGVAIGNQEDVVTLKAVVAWWRDFVDDDRPRWDQRLAGLGADAAFDILRDSACDDELADPVPGAFRFFVWHLGMSAFDAYDVLIIDDPAGRQRLLWRLRDGPIQEAVLEPYSMQRVGRGFLSAWAGARLPH